MEALLARPSSRSDAAMPPMASSGLSYALATSRPYQCIDRAVEVLSLAAVAVTLRVGLKVWRARALARSSPLEPGRVPGDGKVLVCHCAAQLVVFIVILELSGGGQAMAVEQQAALTQDLFLLPQVVGNALWRVNCKPLAEGYYLGVTAARLLLRAYDAVRPPPVVGYSSESMDAGDRLRERERKMTGLIEIIAGGQDGKATSRGGGGWLMGMERENQEIPELGSLELCRQSQ
ncbi:hypothetical protein ACP70R_023031 [Stipagrostis hirtigluma subsp. patula]